MAFYLLSNNQQTFFGVAIVRVVGMAVQMLAWSREGRIERNERWDRGHVYDTEHEPSYSPENLCPSGKCHSMASHHLKSCSTTHIDWSVWTFITFPCVVFLLRLSQILDTWARLWWKLTVLVFSWKATVIIFISIQNCSEVTVVKTVLSRKTLSYSKEGTKKITVKNVEEENMIWPCSFKWDAGIKVHWGLNFLHLLTDLTCSHQMFL